MGRDGEGGMREWGRLLINFAGFLPRSLVAFLGLRNLAVLQPPSALQSSALQLPSTPRSSTHPARGGWGGGKERGWGWGGRVRGEGRRASDQLRPLLPTSSVAILGLPSLVLRSGRLVLRFLSFRFGTAASFLGPAASYLGHRSL